MAFESEIKILISVAKESKDSLLQAAQGIKGLIDNFTALKAASAQGPVGAKESTEAFGAAASAAGDNARSMGDEVEKAHEHLHHLEDATRKAGEAIEFLAGGFLELKSIEFIKDVADVAARVEVLGTVLHVVGGNAGYTKEALDKTDQSVRAMGITAEASREGLTKYIQANFELGKATQLARAAQDLAVISGENSSVTFERMVNAIQTLSTEELRYMGIVVTNDEAQRNYAISIGKTVGALTLQERQTALLHEVLRKAADLTGTYEQAMGDVGKQLTSLPRFIDDLKDALGRSLLPAYLGIIEQLELFLKDMQLTTEATEAQSDAAESLGQTIRSFAENVRLGAEFLIKHREGLVKMGEAFLVFKGFSSLVSWVKELAGLWPSVITGAEFLTGVLAKLAGGTALVGTEAVLLVAGLAAASVAIFGLVTSGTRLGDLLSGIVGILITGLVGALTAVITVFETAAGTIETAVYAIWGLFEPSKWTKIGDIWKGIGNDVAWAVGQTKKFAGATQELLDHARDGKPTPDQEAANNDKLVKARQDISERTGQLVAHMREEDQAQNELTKMQQAMDKGLSKVQGKEITEKRLKDATEARDKAKATVNEANKALGQAYAEASKLGVPKEELEADQRKAEEAKAKRGFETAEMGVMNSQKIATDGWQTDTNGKLIDPGWTAKGGAVNTELENMRDQPGLRTPYNIALAVRGLREAAQASKSPGAVDAMKEMRSWLLDPSKNKGFAPKEILGELNRSIPVVQRNQIQDQEAEGANVRAASKAQSDDKNDVLIEAKQKLLTTNKDTNNLLEAQDKEHLSEGTLSLKQYYSNRIARIQQAANDEISVSEAKIKKLQEGRAFETAEEKRRTDVSIQQERDHRAEVDSRRDNAVQEEQVTQGQKRFELTQQTRELELENQKTLDGVVGAEGAINFKYEERLRQMKALAGAADDEQVRRAQAAVEIAKQNELFENRIAMMERENKLLKEEGQAQVDNLSARVKYFSDRGQFTPQESRQAQNDIASIQIAQRRSELAGINQQIAETSRQLDQVQDKTGAAGIALQDKLAGLKNEALGVQTEMVKLADSIQELGLSLQKSLTDGLSKSLQEIITRTKGAGDAIKELITGFRNNIVKIWADEQASKFINNLIQRTSRPVEGPEGQDRVDEQGNVIPGKKESPFDILAKALGGRGDKKRTGNSEAEALWVQIHNPNGTVTARDVHQPKEQDAKATVTGTDASKQMVTAAGALQSSATVLKEAGKSMASSLLDVAKTIKSVGPVGGAVTGQSVGSEIGTLVGRMSYGKHNAEARRIAEEQDSSMGSRIGGLAGAVFGIGRSIFAPSAVDRLRKAKQIASMGGPVDTESAQSTTLISDPDTATDPSNPGITPTLDTSKLQTAVDETAGNMHSVKDTVQGTAQAAIEAGSQGLFNGLDSTLKTGMQVALSFLGGGGSGGGGGGFLSTLGGLFGLSEGGHVGHGGGKLLYFKEGGPVTFGPDTFYEANDQKALHFDRGGAVSGPGTGTSDSIRAMLSHGEFVVKAAQTQKFLPLLHAVNNNESLNTIHRTLNLPQNRPLPKYADGGLVLASSGAASGSPAASPAGTHGPLVINAHPDMLKMSFQDVLNQCFADAMANR